MTERNNVGGEHLIEFQPGFHDHLARHWPGPRDQLHAGGWDETRYLVRELGINRAGSALDVCCGEGGTAVWLAGTYGVRTGGIDIVCEAVRVAREHAQREGVDGLCTFVCGNVFSLPFPDGSFEVVFGQDPDGFAHARRVVAFEECYRVLRPGGHFGFHHWIPGINAPHEITERFDQSNVEAGYPSHADVHSDAYAQAMREAGFEVVRVVDRSSVYRKHMLAIRERARARGEEVDAWIATWLELSEQHPFGVMVSGRKPT